MRVVAKLANAGGNSSISQRMESLTPTLSDLVS